MASVSVPAAFFRAELRMYADWREALVRELLQNSIDAGATRIDIDLSESDGQTRLRFADDGCGMGRSVLDEVFFALGRTTKHDEETIGGFGRARIITCFAQRGYRIDTLDTVVVGAGGDYSVDHADRFVDGCVFTIDLVETTADACRRALRRVLSTSDVRCAVSIDGAVFSVSKPVGRATRVLRDESGRDWAKVYVVREGTGLLLVRVDGLVMFTRWLGGDEDVVVEIVPRRSRSVLAAGRDQLVASYGAQLDAFVDSVRTDRRRALRDTTRERFVRVDGGGYLVTGDASGACGRDAVGQSTGIEPTPGVALPSGSSAVEVAGRVVRDAGYGFGFDLCIVADGTDPAQARHLRSWDPRRHPLAKGQERLVHHWMRAVSYGIELGIECGVVAGPVRWTVGVLLSSEAVAVCRSDDDGHVFALNPYPARGRYVLGRVVDRRRLLAVALHEVAHLSHATHDEDYATCLTELYAAADPRVADRRIRWRC